MGNIKVQCPTCQKQQEIDLRGRIVIPANGITSIALKAACGHAFQVYVDCNFKVRGYQKTDLVLISEMLELDREIHEILDSTRGKDGNPDTLGSVKGDSIKNDGNALKFKETTEYFYKSRSWIDVYSDRQILAIPITGARPDAITGQEGEPGDANGAATIDDLKREYLMRVKAIEDAIFKLEFSMRKDQNLLSQEELAEKKAKLDELKTRLKAYFKELASPTPAPIPGD